MLRDREDAFFRYLEHIRTGARSILSGITTFCAIKNLLISVHKAIPNEKKHPSQHLLGMEGILGVRQQRTPNKRMINAEASITYC